MLKYIRVMTQLIWRLWFYLHASVVVIVFYPFYYILLQRKSWFPHVFTLYRICARIMLFNSGIITQVTWRYKPKKGVAYIICPNHCSYLDIITTYIAIPEYFHFMGKAELKNIPLFGYFFKEMNIPVDRSSIISSHQAYQRAGEDLENGISVAIFPEGTIPETTPRLKSFKNGAFRLAIEKQIPILPVIYPDNYKLMPDGILRRMSAGRPGISRMVVFPPIETKGLTRQDIESLKVKLHRLLQDELEKLITD